MVYLIPKTLPVLCKHGIRLYPLITCFNMQPLFSEEKSASATGQNQSWN